MDHTKGIELACAECRRRKRKCDGGKPLCSTCLAQKKECIYDHERNNRKRRRDPEEIAHLEEQIDILRQRVKELENCASSNMFTRNATLESIHITPTTSAVGESSGVASDHETRLASAVDEVGNMMWKLKIDSNGDASFIGPSSNLQFGSTPPEPRSDTQLHTGQITMTSKMTSLGELLVDYVLQKELLDIFISAVNPDNQFLESSFLDEYIFHNIEAKLDEILLRTAMFALAACYSARDNATHISNIFYLHAEGLVQKCCRSCPSLLVVRALAILCWRDSL
ncbi:hypothetical protein EAF04_002837 [Stromatinia cepivora]|nr:hypothetical protein EAF04_002837 [Stromatinia cepivora]